MASPTYTFPATITRVLDGDTVAAEPSIHLPDPCVVTDSLRPLPLPHIGRVRTTTFVASATTRVRGLGATWQKLAAAVALEVAALAQWLIARRVEAIRAIIRCPFAWVCVVVRPISGLAVVADVARVLTGYPMHGFHSAVYGDVRRSISGPTSRVLSSYIATGEAPTPPLRARRAALCAFRRSALPYARTFTAGRVCADSRAVCGDAVNRHPARDRTEPASRLCCHLAQGAPALFVRLSHPLRIFIQSWTRMSCTVPLYQFLNTSSLHNNKCITVRGGLSR